MTTEWRIISTAIAVVIGGAIGGIGNLVVRGSSIELPGWDGQTRTIQLGFWSPIITGLIAGIVSLGTTINSIQSNEKFTIGDAITYGIGALLIGIGGSQYLKTRAEAEGAKAELKKAQNNN